MRTEPFQGLYRMCNAGNSREKLEHLPPFPTHIDIEITNCCNFKCIMCPTGMGYQKRKKGYMSDAIYYGILDQIKDYGTPLRFIRWGEPTMHPRWLRYLKDAKGLGIMCHINTNGSLVTDDDIRTLLDMGLDSLKFSFQGVDRESYAAIRNIDFFQQLLGKLDLINRLRGDDEKPFLYVTTTVTTETPEQIERFKRTFEPYCDRISIWSTTLDHMDIERLKTGEREKEMFRKLKENQTIKKVHTECIEVFDKLSINWDGTVSACCRDFDNLMIVGDLKRSTLREIWHSRKLNGYRRLLASMEHDRIKLCRTCYSEP